MSILKIIGVSIATVLAIDFLGFIAWVMSGQMPLDNYFIGTITMHALRLVF